jgi:hypothetical protein
MNSILDTLVVRQVQVAFHELVQLCLWKTRFSKVNSLHVPHELVALTHLILHVFVLAPEFRTELVN